MPSLSVKAPPAHVALTSGIVLDSTYTAKAMAGLLARVARGQDDPERTILFWHTGGLHEY